MINHINFDGLQHSKKYVLVLLCFLPYFSNSDFAITFITNFLFHCIRIKLFIYLFIYKLNDELPLKFNTLLKIISIFSSSLI